MKYGYGLIIGGLMFSSLTAASETPALTGYTEGAEVIRVSSDRDQIDNLADIVYAQVKSVRSVRQLRMSVLVPRTNDLKPAILYFPGGGFISAEHDKFIEMRMALAEAGFVVAAAEYRTIPDVFPAPVQDAKAAVRYLREHAAEYGIDPARIGVMGDSAGGWLAQMVGTTGGDKSFDSGDFLNRSSDVQAVVTLYGISDLRDIGAGFSGPVQKVHQSPAATEALLVNGAAFRDFAGASVNASPEKALKASPVGHIHAGMPPFLIMHGSQDTLVSPLQSARLFQKVKKAGGEARYVLVEGAEHGDNHWYQPAVITRVVAWLRSTLGAPLPSRSAQATDPDATL